MYQEHSYLKYEKKQTRIISPPPQGACEWPGYLFLLIFVMQFYNTTAWWGKPVLCKIHVLLLFYLCQSTGTDNWQSMTCQHKMITKVDSLDRHIRVWTAFCQCLNSLQSRSQMQNPMRIVVVSLTNICKNFIISAAIEWKWDGKLNFFTFVCWSYARARSFNMQEKSQQKKPQHPKHLCTS